MPGASQYGLSPTFSSTLNIFAKKAQRGPQNWFSTVPCRQITSDRKTSERCPKTCEMVGAGYGGRQTGDRSPLSGYLGGLRWFLWSVYFMNTHPPFRGGYRGVGEGGKCTKEPPEPPKRKSLISCLCQKYRLPLLRVLGRSSDVLWQNVICWQHTAPRQGKTALTSPNLFCWDSP